MAFTMWLHAPFNSTLHQVSQRLEGTALFITIYKITALSSFNPQLVQQLAHPVKMFEQDAQSAAHATQLDRTVC